MLTRRPQTPREKNNDNDDACNNSIRKIYWKIETIILMVSKSSTRYFYVN